MGEMELRVLQYFIEIVNNRSITSAAKKMHISQSTLSKQIKELEDEIGTTLFVRGHREISLTEDGYFLYERAQEINNLEKSTLSALQKGTILSGDLRIAAGEGEANQYLTNTFKKLIDKGEKVVIHYDTQDADQIFKHLDSGILDFGVVYTNDSLSQYEKITLPVENITGIVMPKTDKLAAKQTIVATDLAHKNLILPRQVDVNSQIISYLDEYVEDYNVTGTYDMNYNMKAMVSSNIGYAITFDKPDYRTGDLVFKRLSYIEPIKTVLIWRRNKMLSRLANEFLKNIISGEKNFNE